MRRPVVALVLTVSVVGGVAAGVVVDASTSADRTSATPAATLVNRTGDTVHVANEYGADERDPVGLLVYDSNQELVLEPDVPVTIGGTEDGYQIRTRERAERGLTYRIGLEFSGDGLVEVAAPPVTIEAPVVARTSQYEGIADNGPNAVITVADGVVVVVPGQEKAYIGGRISNPINDGARVPPRAVDSAGRSLAWFHQTATGGGFNVTLTQAPYLDDGASREADYLLAKDVRVGETIMVTIQYPSGDVVAPFEVVRGDADGTI